MAFEGIKSTFPSIRTVQTLIHNEALLVLYISFLFLGSFIYLFDIIHKISDTIPSKLSLDIYILQFND